MTFQTWLDLDIQLLLTTLEVLAGSFGLGLITFLGIDRMIREDRRRRKPDIDVYVDQMLAANGIHRNLRKIE